jgi:hypothetical protein
VQVVSILLGAALSGGTSLCLGICLLQKVLRKAERVESLSLAFVAGSACFSQIVYLLCAAGLARRAVLVAVGLVALVGAIRSVRRMGAWQQFSPMPRQWRWLTVPFVLFGVVYFVNALAPEMSPDGSAYHLPVVARYLGAHSFLPITWNFYASLSQGIELLFLPAFSVGGASAAAMVHYLFLLDLAVLMVCYGRRFGFPGPALVAAFLVFASPIVGWDGTSAYNDVAAATILFALFYLLQIWDHNRSLRLLVLIGILAGASYAAKYTAAIALPYALGFVAWKLWRARSPLVRPMLTVAGVSALFILPWMIKNLVFVGNPVAPFGNAYFPNEFVHVSFEKQYVAHLRHYLLTSWTQAPWELTVKGERLQGFFGPVFLLTPLALLALRWRPGRRLLLAGGVFAIPWFFNIGTRFLIPAIPPLALALALALARPAVLLATVALVHAALSWFSPPFRYFDVYAPRIASFPILAALRIEAEDAYLSRRSPGYLIDRMIEREVPPGEKVFSFDPIPEAWTTRQVLIGYYSAQNETLADIFKTAMVPELWSERAYDFYFPSRDLLGLRVVRTGAPNASTWQISELQLFSGGAQIRPDRCWRFDANPNPWDAHYAFDNSLVTRWQSWRSATHGMFLGARFLEPKRIDRVRMLIPADCLKNEVELEGMDSDGSWHLLPVQSTSSPASVTEDLRAAAVGAMLDRGIRYLLVSQGALGANEFYENAGAWGMGRIAESGGAWLYALSAAGSQPHEPAVSTPERAMPPGVYDDMDSRIALHAPWVRDTQFQETYGHTLTYSNVPGASICFRFTGTSLTYVYTRANNRGIAEVWIDDRLMDRLDLYASQTKWGSRTTYNALGPGTHTVRIRVTGQHARQSRDCFVDLDGILVG